MRLIYTATGKRVNTGDVCYIDGEPYVLNQMPEPHKPTSSGKVYLSELPDDNRDRPPACIVRYVSVIGAEWVDREDMEDLGNMTDNEKVCLRISKCPARNCCFTLRNMLNI